MTVYYYILLKCVILAFHSQGTSVAVTLPCLLFLGIMLFCHLNVGGAHTMACSPCQKVGGARAPRAPYVPAPLVYNDMSIILLW